MGSLLLWSLQTHLLLCSCRSHTPRAPRSAFACALLVWILVLQNDLRKIGQTEAEALTLIWPWSCVQSAWSRSAAENTWGQDSGCRQTPETWPLHETDIWALLSLLLGDLLWFLVPSSISSASLGSRVPLHPSHTQVLPPVRSVCRPPLASSPLAPSLPFWCLEDRYMADSTLQNRRRYFRWTFTEVYLELLNYIYYFCL